MNIDLSKYDFPKDLKTMTPKELDLLSYSIRDFLIENVSKTGGHLASNLGIVELTIALHKVFDSPRDKIIWDVGHQTYVHKILTGRANQFSTLRQFKGLSGFPKVNESEHDTFDTGHSSTSISIAAGIAAARDIKNEDYKVIAVIGDGSLTGGLAYEALNNVGASKSKVIVILNDNGMSISKNIGGLSHHLSKLRTSKGYLGFKRNLKSNLQKIPGLGENLSRTLGYAKDRVKYAVLSGGVIFEELGFTYVGPIDGHNIENIIECLEIIKKVDGPVMLHVITKKGKGYKNAEMNPNKFHGIGPFDINTGAVLKKQGITYSKVMGNALVKSAELDNTIVAITAAMGDATGLGDFAKKFPNRYFDVGIAEAHSVTFASGLAKAGMKPLIAIYSSFLQRGYDQIVEDVCMQNLPVVFAVDRAGNVGPDGETHHGILDLSYLSTIPRLTILTPSNGNQLEAMIDYAFKLNSPVAIRYPRGECIYDDIKVNIFEGKNTRISKGSDVDIWAVGKMESTAKEIVQILKMKGINAGLVNVTIAKPLDLFELNINTRLIVTIEDNILADGYGQNMAAAISNESINILNFAWPNKFIEQGTFDELAKEYGLDSITISERICEQLERKA